MIIIPTLLRKLQTVKYLVRPLSKKHCFRTPSDSKLVKGSQTLVKCAREHFGHFFITLRELGFENFSFSDMLNLRVAW